MKNNPPLFSGKIAGLIMWSGLFMLLTILSCGRKALPLPPDVYTPPAVKRLSATIEAGVVRLTWTVPDGHNQREKGLSEIVVFQADRSASCPDCPLVYKPIATIPVWAMAENDQGDLQGVHNLTVDGEGPFAFYLVACSKIGVTGPQSDTIEVVCPPEVR